MSKEKTQNNVTVNAIQASIRTKGLVTTMNHIMDKTKLAKTVSSMVKVDKKEVSEWFNDTNLSLPIDELDAVTTVIGFAINKMRIAKSKPVEAKVAELMKQINVVLEKEDDVSNTARTCIQTIASVASSSLDNVSPEDAARLGVAMVLNIAVSNVDTCDTEPETEVAASEDIKFKEVVSAPQEPLSGVTTTEYVEDVTVEESPETTATINGLVTSVANHIQAMYLPAWEPVYEGRQDELAKAIQVATDKVVRSATVDDVSDIDKFIINNASRISTEVVTSMKVNNAEASSDKKACAKLIIEVAKDLLRDNADIIVDALIEFIPADVMDNLWNSISQDQLDEIFKGYTVKDVEDACKDKHSELRQIVAKAECSEIVEFLAESKDVLGQIPALINQVKDFMGCDDLAGCVEKVLNVNSLSDLVSLFTKRRKPTTKTGQLSGVINSLKNMVSVMVSNSEQKPERTVKVEKLPQSYFDASMLLMDDSGVSLTDKFNALKH